jgi:flavin reductase (DIM6/NTAB) family NADH-FMN oxidoreductase RutF
MTLISLGDERERTRRQVDMTGERRPDADFGLQGISGDHAELRSAFGRFPSGIAALCADLGGDLAGMVATSFSVGVSFDPPLVMFSVQNSSSTWPRLRESARIGVSILGREHAAIAGQLASRKGDRFAGVDVVTAEGGAVFVGDSAIWMACHIVSETPAGDHHIVVLEVEAMRVEHDIEPLVYHGARFRHLSQAG